VVDLEVIALGIGADILSSSLATYAIGALGLVAGTATLIAIGVAYLGITAPLWGTALLAASISYGVAKYYEDDIGKLKDSVISGF